MLESEVLLASIVILAATSSKNLDCSVLSFDKSSSSIEDVDFDEVDVVEIETFRFFSEDPKNDRIIVISLDMSIVQFRRRRSIRRS